MCKNDCCGKNVTVNVCGCCGCGSGGISMTDTVLFEGTLNAVGSYQLTDDVNNYDDVFVLHEQSSGNYRGSFYSPVSGLSSTNLVCHGNGAVSQDIVFEIVNNNVNITLVNENYRIVKIIGRKFN